MRYFICLVFEEDHDENADMCLEEIQLLFDAARVPLIHGSVRQLEDRDDCPECGEKL